jgi:hypothetical protein
MSRSFLAAAAAFAALGAASMAHAGQTQIDLSPYVNQGFDNGGWFIDGNLFEAALPGTTFGNQGSSVAFKVANVDDGKGSHLNFWYGLDDGSGTSLGGPADSVTIPIAVSGVTKVFTLADNTFGLAGNQEFSIIFHGTGGNLVGFYTGAFNTKDYNTPNCSTTGCDATPAATTWYDDGNGIILQLVEWDLPAGFGLSSLNVDQLDYADGAILAGLTVESAGGVPEPASWALMIGGLGLAGGFLRQRRALAAG